MAFEKNGQKYYDTQPTGESNSTVDYTDPTDVPEIDYEIKIRNIQDIRQDTIQQVRIVPIQNKYYKIEIVYKKQEI